MSMKKKIVISLVVIVLLAGVGIAGFFLMNKGKGANGTSKTFANGQAYEVFETDAIKIKYPKWLAMDVSKLPNADAIKVAVSSQGCSFFVKQTELPATSTLQLYTDQVIQNFGSNLHVNETEVIGNQAHLDADIEMGSGAIVKNVSNVYLIDHTLYSMAFVAEKANFPKLCQRTLREVAANVEVK